MTEEMCGGENKLECALDFLKPHRALFLLLELFDCTKGDEPFRSSPIWKFPDKLAACDSFLRNSVKRMEGFITEKWGGIRSITKTSRTNGVSREYAMYGQMNGAARAQTSLAVIKGGLRIDRTEQAALSPYLASTHFVSSLVCQI